MKSGLFFLIKQIPRKDRYDKNKILTEKPSFDGKGQQKPSFIGYYNCIYCNYLYPSLSYDSTTPIDKFCSIECNHLIFSGNNENEK